MPSTDLLAALPTVERTRSLTRALAALDAVIVGFAHEAPMTPYAQDPPALWPGLLDGVPDLDPAAAAAIHRGEPLTAALVAALNPDRDVDAVLAEAAGMRHPVG